ncbi:MAG TPA: beta-N-acetylglucosaminidase domain-containing protein [Acidimicrobiales bacterium]|nr:beta-N-acetylglucosaminidase domain-containing protein [Acidimicrobiales bacterium]
MHSQGALTMTGVVEGFYGPPWSWHDRLDVLQWCAARGLTDYVYAPKDDPKHRTEWREPYDDEELAGFRSLVERSGLRIGVAISPGLSIDDVSTSDRASLLAKIRPLVDLGVVHVGLFLDDLPPDRERSRARRGVDHAALTSWLWEHLGPDVLTSLVPTEYIGTAPSPYLEGLASNLPAEIPIGWTGASVVNDEITTTEARSRADALGGRPPLLWDNVPVNDAVMSDRLFMGPLRGRAPELRDLCAGYLANPMVQARASMLPLASIASWCTAGDPESGWHAAAEELGWRTFAEACDGAVPQRLVRDLIAEADGPGWTAAANALASWLAAATDCGAPGLEDEAAPWLAQTREEAALARRALSLFRRTRPSVEPVSANEWRAVVPDPDDVLARAFAVSASWPAVRRAVPCVFGPRLAVRPAVRQSGSGAWVWRADAIEEDESATDDLVRLALDAAASLDPGATLTVHVDGELVGTGNEVTFTARPGCIVLARHGSMLHRVRVES